MKSVLDYFVDTLFIVCSRLGNLIFQVVGLFVHRPMRVLVLSLGIAVMSGVDLYLTVLYITHMGMNEMNPLARAMMEYQSPAILAAWKLGTVVISVGILLLIRRQRSAELGAWVGCLVMGWLMLHWAGYIETSKGMDMEMVIAQNRDNPSWILISTSEDDRRAVRASVID